MYVALSLDFDVRFRLGGNLFKMSVTHLTKHSEMDQSSDTFEGVVMQYQTFEGGCKVAMKYHSIEQINEAFAVVQDLKQKYGNESVENHLDLLEIEHRFHMANIVVSIVGEVDHLDDETSITRSESFKLTQNDVKNHKQKRKNWVMSDEAKRWAFTSVTTQITHIPMKSHLIEMPSCLDTEGPTKWCQPVNDGKECRVWHRRHKNRRVLTFRVDGDINANLLDVVSVLYEIDLYKDWVPYIQTPLRLGLRDSYVEERFGRIDQVARYKIDFPWPMANRECILMISCVDNFAQKDCLVVKLRSFEDSCIKDRKNALPCPVPDLENKAVPIHVDGGVVCRPKADGTVHMTFLWTINSQMDINDTFLNFFCKIFVRTAFKNFKKICAGAAEDVHLERRQTNPYVYSFVEERMKAHNIPS